MRIVCIGEAMVEMAPTGEPDRFAKSYAGDAFNTAWYLKALWPELSVAFRTRVGVDAISNAFVDFADRSGIETDLIDRDAERSMGLYLITLTKGERSFSYWRSNSAARRLADDPPRLEEAMRGAQVLFFSGITLAILGETGRANLLAALGKARRDGAMVVFDPNLRPRLWSDGKTMCDGVTRGARGADIVLPSFDEEARHFGDLTPEQTIDRYRHAGARTVVVKNGGAAVRYLSGKAQGEVSLEPIDPVVDTTSAGDSFNAGFLVSYLRDGCPVSAIEAGSAVSRQVIEGRGALVSVTRI